VLDFGRTTFGACSTGAAKTALTLAIQHANSRRQFGRTLGEFELVKKKIARMASSVYAMEAMTNITASLIDRGLEDYMAETAMLKVFTTEALWEIVNDSFQIHGGSAYFTDSPLERMLRDTRINLVAEGANEILTSFIALVGLRGPGEQFRELRDALQHPSGGLRRAWRLGLARVGPVLTSPEVPVKSPELSERANGLAKLVHSFNIAADRALIRHKEEILERQYVHERLARAAIEIFASACVLSRWDAELQDPGICSAATRRHFRTARHVVQSQSADVSTHSKEQSAAGSGFYEADLFLRSSARRIRHWLAELRDNDDDATTATADYILGEPAPTSAGTLKP